ncbi:MAG: 3-methyl-2-oxobutanoate hydroxymethyltransferase [Candidatus Heimdallarchaeota archaeon]|nr:3-methyl-2-oxobutanoate hydroxymethyltransferase [Candidatus Heimdallarchaeota archaeon]
MSKVTIPYCIEAKHKGEKLTMLTAYDFPIARLLDEAGIDILLVGDSLGMVIQGNPDSLSVSVDEMVYHTKLVAKAAKRALVVGDMPFMSFQVTVEEAVKNAGRFLKEGNANAIKLEGGREVAKQVKAIVNAGIPVMGHLGLTPQSINQFGGFKVQAKSEYAIKQLIQDAIALERAGCFALVLEAIPEEAARRVTEKISIPTIGIGAGKYVDGQVLVTYDMMGFNDKFKPKFVKRYGNVKSIFDSAIAEYIKEVQQGEFPSKEFTYEIKIEEREEPDVMDKTTEFKRTDIDEFDDLF